jgi:hypothetical protein
VWPDVAAAVVAESASSDFWDAAADFAAVGSPAIEVSFSTPKKYNLRLAKI